MGLFLGYVSCAEAVYDMGILCTMLSTLTVPAPLIRGPSPGNCSVKMTNTQSNINNWANLLSCLF